MQSVNVGNIIGVDGDSIKVQVNVENLVLKIDGETRRIGQLGSYVTIPLEANTLVGLTTAIERQPKAADDAPTPIVMEIQLLGTIRNHVFHRGVNESPTVGDEVHTAGTDDFEVIFGTFDAMVAGSVHPRSFTVGKFASDPRFDVKALGKEFFSKHVAIMGNSGSGKSCCTAKILQEALELPQTQIILFDLHGEYRAAFSDKNGKVLDNVTYLSDRDLVLPYWLLKYDELDALFVDRSDTIHLSNQESFLKMALTELRGRTAVDVNLKAEFTIDTPIYYSLEQLKMYAENLNEARFILNSDQYAFARLAMRSLKAPEQAERMITQRCEFKKGNPEGEVPHALYNGKLLGLINKLDTRLNDRRYDFLLKPLEQAKRSPLFRDVLGPDKSPAELSGALTHLIKLLTGRLEPRTNLTILDLSGIPFNMVDLTVSVITRIIFDFNFWCPVEDRHPVLLVFEEAHNYIPRKEKERSFARFAVERVAKEGRKYGVSAMIISQRPSELSETVLSQCNSMVILRLNNPDDQAYVNKVVSDQFSSLIRMLPSLRPGEGFVLGDAVLMPMRTLIELPRQLPESGDMDYFKCWSMAQPRGDTDAVVQRWWRQQRANTEDASEGADEGSSSKSVETARSASEDGTRGELGAGDEGRGHRRAGVMAPRIRQIVR